MTVLTLLLVSTLAAPLARQTPAPAPPTPQAQPPKPAPAPAPETYSYNPEGRRDPFISLVVRGREASAAPTRQTVGLAGLTINEVALRGIVRSRGAYVAILQAPDNKSYIVKVGERLADGVVKSIVADAVVFAQEVNDPLSLVKQREIRKPLRVIEEGS